MRGTKALVSLVGAAVVKRSCSVVWLGLLLGLGACADEERSDNPPASQTPPCTVSTCAKAAEACEVFPTLCSKDAEQAKANPEEYKADCVFVFTQIAEKTHEKNPEQDPDEMMAKFTDCVKSATTCFVATNCSSNLDP